MPVTARLSQLFYERLGEQVADELVGWFNDVDDTYRSDLREVNELNFARFDARLEQRVSESDSRLERRFAQFEVKIEKRLAAFEVTIETRLAAFEVKIEKRLAEFEVRIEQRMAALEVRVERRLTEQTRWMFAMWAIQMVAIMGLWFRG